jgi:hypothetical protein
MESRLHLDPASAGRCHFQCNVAIRLNNLAGLLRATNRLAEAESLYRRALAIDEKSFGPDHPNVASRFTSKCCESSLSSALHGARASTLSRGDQ